jgi:hypothetical protein
VPNGASLLSACNHSRGTAHTGESIPATHCQQHSQRLMMPPLRISLPLYSCRLCWNVGWHPITFLQLTICTAPQLHPNLLSLSPLLNSNLTFCYRLLTVNVQPTAAANPPFSPLHSSKARHHFDQIHVEQLTTDGHFHLKSAFAWNGRGQCNSRGTIAPWLRCYWGQVR